MRMNKETALKVCDLISQEGYTCVEACKELGIKDTAFYYWNNKEPEVFEAYARAREIQAHRWADELISLADDTSEDQKMGKDRRGSDRPYFDVDHIHRVKLRIDTRKWLLSKILSKFYGDKLEVDHGVKESVDLKDIISFSDKSR